MVAAGVVGVTAGSLLPATAAVAAAKEKAAKSANKLSAEVAKPLQAAQAAMNAKNWDEALVQIQAAQAVEPKQPYDAFMIDELGWYVYLQKKDYVQSAAALERSLNSGFVPDADKPQRVRAMTQLSLQNKDYAKGVQYGQQYLQLNPNDAEVALSVAQAKYLMNDYAGAKQAAEALVASSPTPSEQALLLSLRASYELKDDPGVTKALEGLVRHYPQPKYWEDLLNNQLFKTKDERGLRALYRLMDETQTLDKSDEYAEMGSSLITGGFPNEAKGVLERGIQTNAIQGANKEHATAELERAKTGAALDNKELATAANQLAAAKTGDQMVAIGKLYFSAGEYDKAADALQKGLAKGGVKDTDDATMLLGIAQTRAQKPTEAKAAFDAIKAPALVEVARLWKLKLDAAAAPPAQAQTPPAPTSG
jgi:Tfp pilus assembly protein PilF